MSRIENGRIIVIGKNHQMSPALSHSTARVAHAARPFVLPDRGRAAPHYDATAERWVVSPSSMMEDAVAPADQGSTSFVHSSLKLVSPVASNPAGETFREKALEVFTVAMGLTVFGLIAGFFLVLA